MSCAAPKLGAADETGSLEAPPPPRVFAAEQIYAAVRVDIRAVAAAEAAFRQLGSGEVVTPPVQQIDLPGRRGQTCVKSGYRSGSQYFVVKVASTFRDNPHDGLTARSGVMLIFDARTGFVDTVLLDNGYLTAVRTAAAGALAARLLSRPDSTSAAIIGAGKQAELQLEALTLVRRISVATVWAPRTSAAASFARRLSARLGIAVLASPTVAAAVREADIVVTATPATAPVLRAADLRSGTHVTAVGADNPGKGELEPAVVAMADPYVCDLQAQVAVLGELRAALAASVLPAGFVALELGQLLDAGSTWQRRPEAVTVCDLTGVGIQDTEIALLARGLLRDA